MAKTQEYIPRYSSAQARLLLLISRNFFVKKQNTSDITNLGRRHRQHRHRRVRPHQPALRVLLRLPVRELQPVRQTRVGADEKIRF